VACDRLPEAFHEPNIFQADHGSDREKILAAAAAIVHARKAVAKTYRRHLGTRLINWWFRTLTKLGLGASYRHILTVPGRKTGRLHSTPVDVVEAGGQRWLVAGYGPANWVLNTRTAGEVALSRGGRSETYKVEEAGPEDAIPVLRKYIAEIRVTRPYFDAAPNASDEAVAAELPRHAVFRLIPAR
jgi:deazaflavin-dependent oxidoreductase (nitroreductase family)